MKVLFLIFCGVSFSAFAATEAQADKAITDFNMILAFVYICSFAIQQTIGVLEPLVIKYISPIFPEIENPDYKKGIIFGVSSFLGWSICRLTEIDFLTYIKFNDGQPVSSGIGFLVSGLMLGSGTEAVNNVQKYFGYIKEAKKNVSDIVLSIVPDKVSLEKGGKVEISAIIENSEDDSVDWKILEDNAGAFDSTTNIYTAPNNEGTYHLRAKSKVNPKKIQTCLITVK